MRISLTTWEGSRNVDIRLWSRRRDGGEDYVPSRKGVMFAANKLDDVIEGLEEARKQA